MPCLLIAAYKRLSCRSLLFAPGSQAPGLIFGSQGSPHGFLSNNSIGIFWKSLEMHMASIHLAKYFSNEKENQKIAHS